MKHYESHSPFETLCGHEYDPGHIQILDGQEPDCSTCLYLMCEHMQEEANKMESYVHPEHQYWELYHQLCMLTPPKKWPFHGVERKP